METYKLLKSERRKRIVGILAKGLSRCVDRLDKSSYISELEENKDSQNVAYEVDIPQDKSVSKTHENEKHR